MALQSGDRLGAYEIRAPLGSGGAGEVFRAFDTRLHREVALKVLPEELALAEARAAAALKHPGIVPVYDVGEENGVAYMVSELVEGQSLRQLLDAGPLPQSRAIDLAAQIADSLAAAHAAGVTHRDLKPENVIVDPTGRARILDFGLARHAAAPEEQPVTRERPIRGTVGYMSPEQVRGRALDARSDLFSFGVVLHEMLGGRRTFAGESSADVISAILQEDPADLPASISPQLRQIVHRCLDKDPAQRFQSAADLAFALRTFSPAAPVHVAPPVARARRSWGLVIFAACCATLAVATLFLRPAQSPVYEITPLTAFSGSEIHPALSRDGRQLAFVWAGEPPDIPGVYVKQVAGGQPLRISPRRLPANYPCWSDDGTHVAYTRADSGRASILVVPASGGPERRIAQFPGTATPLDWSRDGKWIAGTIRSAESESILLVSTENGTRHTVSDAPAGWQDRNPAFSPDAKTLAFIRTSSPTSNYIYQVNLRADGTASGRAGPIGSREWNSRSVDWMEDGKHICIASVVGSQLQFWSIPANGGEARRLPLELPNDTSTVDQAQISISGTRLAVVQSSLELDVGRLECSADSCREGTYYGSSRSDAEPQLSPDGKRLVVSSTRSGYREIWRTDADGSNALQLTNFAGIRPGSPRWSPDGQTIVFDAYRGGNTDIWTVSAAGGAPTRLTTDSTNEYRPSFSHDGQWIYFGSNRAGNEVWKIPAGGGEAQPVTHNGGYEAFESPDGKWLYYTKAGGRPRDGIYRVLLAGGAEELVAREPNARAWSVAENRVYLGLVEPDSIVAVDPATHRHEEVYRFPAGVTRWNFSTALSVSPDGRAIYHSGTRRNDSDILLVENFR